MSSFWRKFAPEGVLRQEKGVQKWVKKEKIGKKRVAKSGEERKGDLKIRMKRVGMGAGNTKK